MGADKGKGKPTERIFYAGRWWSATEKEMLISLAAALTTRQFERVFAEGALDGRLIAEECDSQ